MASILAAISRRFLRCHLLFRHLCISSSIGVYISSYFREYGILDTSSASFKTPYWGVAAKYSLSKSPFWLADSRPYTIPPPVLLQICILDKVPSRLHITALGSDANGISSWERSISASFGPLGPGRLSPISEDPFPKIIYRRASQNDLAGLACKESILLAPWIRNGAGRSHFILVDHIGQPSDGFNCMFFIQAYFPILWQELSSVIHT